MTILCFQKRRPVIGLRLQLHISLCTHGHSLKTLKCAVATYLVLDICPMGGFFCNKLATSCVGGGGLRFDCCLGWNMRGLSVPSQPSLGGSGEASVGALLVAWQQQSPGRWTTWKSMAKNVYVQH